jgi:hypothetical protein
MREHSINRERRQINFRLVEKENDSIYAQLLHRVVSDESANSGSVCGSRTFVRVAVLGRLDDGG